MFTYTLEKKDWHARVWTFQTEHWDIKTPVFMPVGTKASVKWINLQDLEEIWAQIILNNTYHLYLRPWDQTVAHFGWVHEFQNYHKPILTDSGWFQVFSLWNTKSWESLVKITEEWVHFRSYQDGSKHYFDAESVMNIQSNLWADIIMAFDECAPWESSKQYARAAMERTHRWAERCVAQWKINNEKRTANWQYLQALFPICQWVVYDDLRAESAQFVSALDCPGVAIGWLSVGEWKEDMYRTLDVVNQHLSEDKPRYLMWVGTPVDLIEWIDRGVDMFDCVLPTRIGRHGRAFSSTWDINLKNAVHKLSEEPIDNKCQCKICKNYTRGYIRHLITENEIEWMSMISYHNLYFIVNLAREAREAILDWKYSNFKAEFYKNLQM